MHHHDKTRSTPRGVRSPHQNFHSTYAGQTEEEELGRDARTWKRALDEIMQTLCFTRPLFPDCGSMGLPGICEEEGEPVAEKSVPDRYHLALFIQETMLKMLAFVDVVVAWDSYTTEEFLSMDSVMLPPYSKLFNQLVVHDALSEASYKILTLFDSTTSEEVQRIENKMAILLSEYDSKLREATRSTTEKIRTKLMEHGDNLSSPQGSSDIHKVTQYIMRYIRFLCSNYSLVEAIIWDKYVDSMIREVVSCLQEKLASILESFPDQGLRFLFMLNNSYFIMEQLNHYSHSYSYYLRRLRIPDVDLRKFVAYRERDIYKYHGHRCCHACSILRLFAWGKNYSPLSKFDSEFEKIYTTQKQWKVLDPWYRGRLRGLITDKIIPSYTEYIEDNKVTNPKFSPQELQEMLQEPFEG